MRKFTHIKYNLDFKFNAGTSRGVLKQKETHLIKIWDDISPEIFGIGEAGMFRGLSADDNSDFEDNLKIALNEWVETGNVTANQWRSNPSVLMGLEMAIQDLNNGGSRTIFNSSFSQGQSTIPINGLIWMGEKKFMKTQIIEKIEQGFDCIKLKIGALDFNLECDLLKFIRSEFQKDIILRVDANGAFAPEEALEKLNQLSTYNLHSIEQPIQAGQWEVMAELCEKTPVDIALDEELIGVTDFEVKKRMLEIIQPQYIILKPSLLGGFVLSDEWVDLAGSKDIGWWVTSALESNIGLNAIAQWTSQLPYIGHQGLGTGGLFQNNFDSPLQVRNGMLFHDPKQNWSLENINDFNGTL